MGAILGILDDADNEASTRLRRAPRASSPRAHPRVADPEGDVPCRRGWPSRGSAPFGSQEKNTQDARLAARGATRRARRRRPCRLRDCFPLNDASQACSEGRRRTADGDERACDGLYACRGRLSPGVLLCRGRAERWAQRTECVPGRGDSPSAASPSLLHERVARSPSARRALLAVGFGSMVARLCARKVRAADSLGDRAPGRLARRAPAPTPRARADAAVRGGAYDRWRSSVPRSSLSTPVLDLPDVHRAVHQRQRQPRRRAG